MAMAETTMDDNQPTTTPTRWRTVKQAAARALTGEKLIYREMKAGRIRHAKIGGRREIRTTDEWIDEWLEASAKPIEVRR
jgi:hypothetical protein